MEMCQLWQAQRLDVCCLNMPANLRDVSEMSLNYLDEEKKVSPILWLPFVSLFFPPVIGKIKKKKQSNPQMKKFQILHNCRKINPLIQATKKVLVSVTLYFRSSCFWFWVGFAFHLIKPRFPGSAKVNARFIKRLSSKKNFHLLWTRGTKAHETQSANVECFIEEYYIQYSDPSHYID